jgi:hypothetical protein
MTKKKEYLYYLKAKLNLDDKYLHIFFKKHKTSSIKYKYNAL